MTLNFPETPFGEVVSFLQDITGLNITVADEVADVVDHVEVVTGVEGGLAFVVVAGPEHALDLTAERFERGGGEDGFRRAADAHEHVDAAVLERGRDAGVDVAGGDQFDSSAGGSAFGD